MQQPNHEAVILAEENGGGFDADFQVVGAVGHRISGVIRHDPGDVGSHKQPGEWWHMARLRREGHGYAPAKGQAQIGLRQVGEAFEKRVADGENERHPGKQKLTLSFQLPPLNTLDLSDIRVVIP